MKICELVFVHALGDGLASTTDSQKARLHDFFDSERFENLEQGLGLSGVSGYLDDERIGGNVNNTCTE